MFAHNLDEAQALYGQLQGLRADAWALDAAPDELLHVVATCTSMEYTKISVQLDRIPKAVALEALHRRIDAVRSRLIALGVTPDE